MCDVWLSRRKKKEVGIWRICKTPQKGQPNVSGFLTLPVRYSHHEDHTGLWAWNFPGILLLLIPGINSLCGSSTFFDKVVNYLLILIALKRYWWWSGSALVVARHLCSGEYCINRGLVAIPLLIVYYILWCWQRNSIWLLTFYDH